MAQFAIVKSSDLAREGRWDAGFHIALKEVEERVAELRREFTPEQCTERLSGIALADKQPLLILGRGQQQRSLSTANVDRIVAEYPYLSLAIMEKNLQPAIERVRNKIAEDEKHLDALLAIARPAVTPTPDATGR